MDNETAQLSLENTRLKRKLDRTKKKLVSANDTLQAKEREWESEKDQTLKQVSHENNKHYFFDIFKTQALMNKVDEAKLGVATWLESSRNELEFANSALSEKSDVLEREKRVIISLASVTI